MGRRLGGICCIEGRPCCLQCCFFCGCSLQTGLAFFTFVGMMRDIYYLLQINGPYQVYSRLNKDDAQSYYMTELLIFGYGCLHCFANIIGLNGCLRSDRKLLIIHNVLRTLFLLSMIACLVCSIYFGSIIPGSRLDWYGSKFTRSFIVNKRNKRAFSYFIMLICVEIIDELWILLISANLATGVKYGLKGNEKTLADMEKNRMHAGLPFRLSVAGQTSSFESMGKGYDHQNAKKGSGGQGKGMQFQKGGNFGKSNSINSNASGTVHQGPKITNLLEAENNNVEMQDMEGGPKRRTSQKSK